MATLDLPAGRRHELLCDTARLVWRPAAGAPLPTGGDKARWLARWITTAWGELGRPCSRAAVDHAVACAERRARAHDGRRAVLVHGDVHQWNALATGEGFKLVDPDGLVAEPECDLGVLLREDPVELLEGEPTARARLLAARTGLDAAAIWEWGVAERDSARLWGKLTLDGFQAGLSWRIILHRREAFRRAFRELENRIRIFASLRVEALSRIALKKKLDEIGRLSLTDPVTSTR